MIAINWFEVLLPSTVFEIPTEHLVDTSVPRQRKSIRYRTVLRVKDSARILYYITDSPPEGTKIEKINCNDDPSILKYAIEYGFAARLEEVGLKVFLKHVGGIGYQNVDNSIRPSIYRAVEGIKFRCFYGFGQNEQTKQLRWGLVLRWVTRQYFNISLQDKYLKDLALGRRVVSLSIDDDKDSDNDSYDSDQRSGILDSIQNEKGILVDRDGERWSVSLDTYTLPCSQTNLLGYIRGVEGPKSASEVSTKLQQDALVLTAEGRMNTALARDQLQKLQVLMTENNLLTFHLPLPGKPFARVSHKPLIVGT